MNIIEALNKSPGLKARRKGWSDMTFAHFFKGVKGMRIEIEMLKVGMEFDPEYTDWFADDWEPVEGE